MKLSKYKVGIIAAGLMAMQTCSTFAAAPTPTAVAPVKGSEIVVPVNTVVVNAKGNTVAVAKRTAANYSKGSTIAFAKSHDAATKDTKTVAEIGINGQTVTPAPASDDTVPAAVNQMPVQVTKAATKSAIAQTKSAAASAAKSAKAKSKTSASATKSTTKSATARAKTAAAATSAKTTVIPATVTPAPLDATASVAQTAPKQPEIKRPIPAPQPAAEPARIVINTANRALYLFKNGKSVRMYPIAVGKPSTPTPIGYFSVIEKDVNPVWVDPDDPTNRAEAGEGNPLGQRWLGIGGNYGIHGNSNESSISHYVSNGCIRLHNADIEELYDLVEVGTPVEIYYNRCVVNKNGENTIAFYIYPDAYGRQPLTVADVNKWLNDFGVGDFVSDASIQSSIEAEDGEPTYIAKAYPVYVNGKATNAKMVIYDGTEYMPANKVAEALGVSIGWAADKGKLFTSAGSAAGYLFKNTLYFDLDDMTALFGRRAEFTGSQVLI